MEHPEEKATSSQEETPSVRYSLSAEDELPTNSGRFNGNDLRQQTEDNPRPRYCTNCGNLLPDDCKFCPNCGHKVKVDTPPPPPPQSPSVIQVEPTPSHMHSESSRKQSQLNSKGSSNSKSLVKDIAILLSVWGPLLFILIGGVIWLNDGFDGTIMERLFPALFFGLCTAFFAIIIASNLLPDYPSIWWVSGGVLGITMIVLRMCNADTLSIVLFIACCVAICLLALVKWISRLLK